MVVANDSFRKYFPLLTLELDIKVLIVSKRLKRLSTLRASCDFQREDRFDPVLGKALTLQSTTTCAKSFVSEGNVSTTRRASQAYSLVFPGVLEEQTLTNVDN